MIWAYRSCHNWVKFVGHPVRVHWERENCLMVLENIPRHPTQGDRQTLGTESCHRSEAAKVHLSLWALAWCHAWNSCHSLSGDHAHLLRSMRCLQNARSCSGRRNSQTPGAHYHYLCFYLTKGSPGRQAWHHQSNLSLVAHSPRGGFSFQLLSSPKYYLQHRGLSCHFLFQIQCLWYC